MGIMTETQRAEYLRGVDAGKASFRAGDVYQLDSDNESWSLGFCDGWTTAEDSTDTAAQSPVRSAHHLFALMYPDRAAALIEHGISVRRLAVVDLGHALRVTMKMYVPTDVDQEQLKIAVMDIFPDAGVVDWNWPASGVHVSWDQPGPVDPEDDPAEN